MSIFNEHFPMLFNDFYFDKDNNYFPKVKINKEEKGYELKFALPGLKKDDVNIQVDNGIISVSYSDEKKNDNSIFISKFKKSYELPNDVNTDDISGKFKDGILTIKLPFKEEVKTMKVIEIT